MIWVVSWVARHSLQSHRIDFASQQTCSSAVLTSKISQLSFAVPRLTEGQLILCISYCIEALRGSTGTRKVSQFAALRYSLCRKFTIHGFWPNYCQDRRGKDWPEVITTPWVSMRPARFAFLLHFEKSQGLEIQTIVPSSSAWHLSAFLHLSARYFCAVLLWRRFWHRYNCWPGDNYGGRMAIIGGKFWCRVLEGKPFLTVESLRMSCILALSLWMLLRDIWIMLFIFSCLKLLKLGGKLAQSLTDLIELLSKS